MGVQQFQLVLLPVLSSGTGCDGAVMQHTSKVLQPVLQYGADSAPSA